MQYSIVNYKKVRQITEDFRFDADYFKPKYLKEDKQRTYFENIQVGDFCYVTDGQHGYHEVDESSPIYHLTAKNAKGWFANTENADRLAKWVDDKNKRSSLKERDLILSTRGTVGLCALVKREALPANIDQDVARIAVNAKAEVEPEFLLAYLNCEFGQDWLIRNSSGMVQQGISLDKVRSIPIPLLSSGFQKYCGQIVEAGYKTLRDSEILYLQAEQVILSELGLLNWKPKHRLSFVKKYSDTQASGRIDAEYFQPIYDDILNSIKRHPSGFVGDVFKQNRSVFKRNLDKLFRYIEIGSVNTSSGEVEPLLLSGKELPANAKIKLNKDDLIISKVRTYRGAVAIIQDDGLVGSGAFTVLRESEKVNKETAFVFFKSAPILRLSLKYNAGTSYPVIDDKDILNIPFPLIDKKIQADIKQKVSKMYELKLLSRNLLDIAKRGVEMAIEKSERDAQNWINAELKKLNIRLD